jgi:hypothetical protein
VAYLLGAVLNWPLPEPLVHASSHQYYWTIAKLNLICVPAVDDFIPALARPVP